MRGREKCVPAVYLIERHRLIVSPEPAKSSSPISAYACCIVGIGEWSWATGSATEMYVPVMLAE